MVRDEPPWSQVLPFVLLGLRAAVHEESTASPADLAYVENQRLPNDHVLVKRNGLGETGLLRLLREESFSD